LSESNAKLEKTTNEFVVSYKNWTTYLYRIPSPSSGADSTGHPTIAAAGCSSSIEDVNIHFHGGAR